MITERVLELESLKDHYQADACIFWCIDDRLRTLRDTFIEQRGFNHVDLIQFAGGAKLLTDPASSLIEQMDISQRLHNAKLAIIAVHADCGAYGGSKAFGYNRAVEYHDLSAELAKAETVLKARFPELVVERYIADFDGLHKG